MVKRTHRFKRLQLNQPRQQLRHIQRMRIVPMAGHRMAEKLRLIRRSQSSKSWKNHQKSQPHQRIPKNSNQLAIHPIWFILHGPKSMAAFVRVQAERVMQNNCGTHFAYNQHRNHFNLQSKNGNRAVKLVMDIFSIR